MSDLAAALQVAIRVHAGQVDKAGEPYLLHVLRVVEAVSDEAKVVAALHDVIEDGGERARRAVAGLDLSECERVALCLLTRDGSCGYDSYIAAINCRPADDLAREVKIADIRDNLRRINPAEATTWEPLRRRYERALATLEGSQLQVAPNSSKDLGLREDNTP